MAVIDAEKLMQYVTSCYWAVTTIATVGYGDITPSNESELIVNILIILIGVTFYSYIVSRVTATFTTTVSDSQLRTELIEEFLNGRIDSNDLQNITRFYTKIQPDDRVIRMYDFNNVGQMLSICPIHFKSETNYFLYKDAIDTVKLL